jgi:hypothetical protein
MPTEIDEDEDVIEAQVEDEEEEVDDDNAEESLPTAMSATVHFSNDNDDDEDEAVIAEDVEMDEDDVDDDDEDEDEDQEEVLAAVVVEEDDDDTNGDEDGSVVEDISVVVAEPVFTALETPKRKTKSPIKSSSAPPNKSKATSTSNQPTPNTSDARKSVNKKKRRQNAAGNSNTNTKSDVVDPIDEMYKSLPARKVTAARDARAMLRETVSTLPVSIGETQIRSFGQLCIQSMPSSVITKQSNQQEHPLIHKNPFHTLTALYPIGFSCDRYELSPVHGRILKMRCSILDGRSIKATQKRNGSPIQSELPDGPIFRIMWGRGIDEDSTSKNDSVEHPFDMYAHSTPIVSTGSVKNDTLISNAIKSMKRSNIIPKVGMRVNVSCDKDQYFTGTIATVSEPKLVTNTSNGKKKRKRYDIMIHYDDGLKEEMSFPDPDLELVIPGTVIKYQYVNTAQFKLNFSFLLLYAKALNTKSDPMVK